MYLGVAGLWRVRHPPTKQKRQARGQAARRRAPPPTAAAGRASGPIRVKDPTARGAARRKLPKVQKQAAQKAF